MQMCQLIILKDDHYIFYYTLSLQVVLFQQD